MNIKGDNLCKMTSAMSDTHADTETTLYLVPRAVTEYLTGLATKLLKALMTCYAYKSYVNV